MVRRSNERRALGFVAAALPLVAASVILASLAEARYRDALAASFARPWTRELARAKLAAEGLPRAIYERVVAAPDAFFALLSRAEREDDGEVYRIVDRENLVSPLPPTDLELLPPELVEQGRSRLALRPGALAALKDMVAAASEEGLRVRVVSGYRTADEAIAIMKRFVAESGYATARRFVAPPGASQHHLGTAVDFSDSTFDRSAARRGAWIHERAWTFGYSMSYPWGAESLTGYAHEPWHYRWLGVTMTLLERAYFGGIQVYLLAFYDAWKRGGAPAPRAANTLVPDATAPSSGGGPDAAVPSAEPRSGAYDPVGSFLEPFGDSAASP